MRNVMHPSINRRTTSRGPLARATVLACAVTLATVGLVQAPAAAITTYELVDLGKLGRDADGIAINAHSEVVGEFYDPTVPHRGAFLSSPTRTGGAMVELPGPPCPGCGPMTTTATAITDDCDIAGTARLPDGDHAVVWSGGVVHDLGQFTGNTVVEAMNEAGQLVGYGTVDGFRHAYLYTPGIGFRELAPELPHSMAYDINDRGQVVGECGQDVSHHDACLWNPDGTLTRVAVAASGYNAEAMGINDQGVVVGAYGDAYRHSMPFRWADGVLTALVDPSFPSAVATDVNDAGVIVGYRYLRDALGPFAWQGGQVTNLPAYGIGPRAGTAIPRDINAAGEITGDSGTASDPWHHAVIWRPIG